MGNHCGRQNNVGDCIGVADKFGGDTIEAFVDVNSWLGNGSTQSITVPNNAAYDFGDGVDDSPFSVSVWLKMPVTGSTKMIIAKGEDTSNLEWLISVSSGGEVRCVLYDQILGARRGAVTNLLSPTADTYELWIFTYDGRGGADANDGINIYRNLTQVNTGGQTAGSYTAMEVTGSDIHIGEFSGGSFFSDNEDEIGIWSKELDSADRTAIFNGDGAGCPGNLKIHPSSGFLVSWFSFNNDLFPVVIDKQGLQNGSMINSSQANIDTDIVCP